mgnify:CR=1 FL=1
MQIGFPVLFNYRRKEYVIHEKKSRTAATNLSLFLIALPGILYLLINNYAPMLGIFLAFKNYSLMKGPFKSDWCGFDNFEFLFKTKDAWIMTRNTLLYNTAFIIIGTVAAILVAILMCELGEKKRVKFYQAVMLLPNLLSWVVIGFIAYAFLNADTGFINNTFLRWLGLDPVAWYSTPGAWPIILVIVNLWKNVGYQSIIFMAAISGIDKSLFEAAAIDGCRPAGTFFKIVMPISKTVYATVFILDFVAHWNDFMWPFLVMTGEDKRTIQLAVQSFFGTQPVHYSAIMAALVISAIPMIIMFIFMQKYYVEGIASSGIKG